MISQNSAIHPLAGHSRSPDVWWMLAVFVSVTIVGLVALVPWLEYGPRLVVDLAFRTLCHQEVDRSFQVDGIPFAVCHRCFGIYSGIAAGLLSRPLASKFGGLLRRRAVPILLGPVVLVCLDWGLGAAGIWDNTPLTRLATGFALGFAGGLYLGLAMTEGAELPKTRVSITGFDNDR